MRYLLSEIAKICGGELIGTDRTVSDVLTDSRRSGGGEQTLFVAIDGANHDSHCFIEQMLRAGTKAFMVERSDAAQNPAGSYVVIGNSIAALQKLASYHRSQFSGRVVAIIGSNGKTILKEWAAQSYNAKGKLFSSPRSYNSQLGVALSLLKCTGCEDIALIEAGISKCGEMEILQRMVRPEIVVITSIGEAHQEGFATIEQKVEQKMIMAKDAKVVIYHSAYAPLAEYFESHTYIYKLIDAASYRGGNFSEITSKRNSQIIDTLLSLCNCSGYELDSFSPVAMRLEVKEGLNDSVIVNDSYNSCVTSLAIALDTLNSVAAGRPTTLILSEILQSGATQEELYADVAKVIAAANVDRVIGVGSRIDKWLNCSYFNSTEELMANIKREDYASRAILLKGNRASRFERLSHSLERRSHTTRLEIDLDAMVANLNYFRQQTAQNAKLIAMVKASSYGAGDFEVAQTLTAQGIDYLAVAFVDEGVALRERGITAPIIVLNADDDSFEPMIQMRLEPEIYSLRSLRQFIGALQKNGESDYPIHIKIDSGMHRLGFERQDIAELTAELNENRDRVHVASIFSHLSCADESDGKEFTLAQIELFKELSEQIIAQIGYRPMRHIANSAAMERFPEARFDACRLGIGLYGFGVSEKSLTPIATLKSRIVQIKHHKAGTAIGYGAAERLSRDSVIATVPIGYADGLCRAAGCGKWSMLLGGSPAPIVGRVCMDSVMIDITECEGASEGDEVTIFSTAAGNRASDMATITGTIPYEILTSISKRVKRVYLKE
ncbi:MAG: alanine racemase [Rikenellaceae bacterium]